MEVTHIANQHLRLKGISRTLHDLKIKMRKLTKSQVIHANERGSVMEMKKTCARIPKKNCSNTVDRITKISTMHSSNVVTFSPFTSIPFSDVGICNGKNVGIFSLMIFFIDVEL